MVADSRETKGINLVDLVRTLRTLHKAGMVGELPPEEAKYLQERVLVSSWYPFEDFMRILNRVHVAMGGTDGAAEQMGEFGAQSALTGAHKIFLRQGDPEGTVRALEQIWSGQFNFGQVHVESEGDRIEVTVDGYPDIPPAHGSLLVGWVRKAIELASGTPGVVRIDRAPWLGNGKFVVVVTVPG